MTLVEFDVRDHILLRCDACGTIFVDKGQSAAGCFVCGLFQGLYGLLMWAEKLDANAAAHGMVNLTAPPKVGSRAERRQRMRDVMRSRRIKMNGGTPREVTQTGGIKEMLESDEPVEPAEPDEPTESTAPDDDGDDEEGDED